MTSDAPRGREERVRVASCGLRRRHVVLVGATVVVAYPLARLAVDPVGFFTQWVYPMVEPLFGFLET